MGLNEQLPDDNEVHDIGRFIVEELEDDDEAASYIDSDDAAMDLEGDPDDVTEMNRKRGQFLEVFDYVLPEIFSLGLKFEIISERLDIFKMCQYTLDLYFYWYFFCISTILANIHSL